MVVIVQERQNLIYHTRFFWGSGVVGVVGGGSKIIFESVVTDNSF